MIESLKVKVVSVKVGLSGLPRQLVLPVRVVPLTSLQGALEIL